MALHCPLTPRTRAPLTLSDGVQRLHGHKSLGRSRCTSQTGLRHLQHLELDVNPKFLRMVGIVIIAGTPQVPVCTHVKTLDLKTAEPNRIRLDGAILLNFLGTHENCVVDSGKLGAQKDPALLDESPALFPCASGIEIINPAVQIRPLETRSSYRQSRTFEMSRALRSL